MHNEYIHSSQAALRSQNLEHDYRDQDKTDFS